MYIENVAPANQSERITQLSTAEVQSSFHFQGISGDAATQVAFFLQCNSKNVHVALHIAYYLLSATFPLGNTNLTAVLLIYRCVRQLSGWHPYSLQKEMFSPPLG